MTLNIAQNHAPLTLDRDGVARVGGSRVPLETVVGAFTLGATAEQIAERFPSLTLADVYSTIGYYLSHRDEVDEYIAERDDQAKRVKAMIDARGDLSNIRERLIHRSQHGKQTA